MKGLTIIFLLLFHITSIAQDVYGVSYQPPMLPFSIILSNQGLSVKASGSINTPVGEFGLYASNSLIKKDDDVVDIPMKENANPIYIEIPKYDTITKYIEKPIIKITEVEKIVTKTILDKSYVIELRNFNGKSKQEFIISGVDIMLIEAEGKTKIEAKEGRMIIDLSNSKLTQLNFRGGNLGHEDFNDILTKLLLKYNDMNNFQSKIRNSSSNSYINNNGFIVLSDYNNFSQYYNFKSLRRLEDDFNINYKDLPIGYYRKHILVTKKGIGINHALIKKGVKKFPKKKYERNNHIFLNWNQFLNLAYSIKKDKTGKELILLKNIGTDKHDAYFERFGGGEFTKNNIVQFFNELKETIIKEIR